jgi:hypothetical protein
MDLGPPIGIPDLVVLRVIEPLAVRRQHLVIVRRLRERPRQAVELGANIASLPQRIVEYVGHCRVGLERQLLTQKPEPYHGAIVGLVLPASSRKSVDLPTPSSPIRPIRWPGDAMSETPPSTRRVPNVRTRS